MRTKAAVLVVFVIGVAATMILMSGFASVWGTDPPQVERASDRVNESASSVSPDDEPVSGPVSWSREWGRSQTSPERCFSCQLR
jgi:hypothetical protein